MHIIKKAILGMAVALTFSAAPLAAAGEVLDIPGIGEVGLEKNGKDWTVALADWGTWQFRGQFKNKKDFDLATSLPAGDFTDYIPGVGQILAVLGLDTVDIRLKPSGLGLGLNLESGGLGTLRGMVTDNLSRVKSLKVIINKIIEGFEIKNMSINASVFGKTLTGKVEGTIAIIGKKFNFDFEGELNLKKMLSSVVNKIIPEVADYAADLAKAAYKKSKDAVVKIGRTGANKAKKAWNAMSKELKEAWDVAKKATSSYDHNKKVDLPKFVNAMGNPMIRESNKAVDELYDELAPEVRDLEDAEKGKLVDDAFAELSKELDDRWDEIYKDKTTNKWTVLDKREKELRKMYRDGIQKKWDEHKNYRAAKAAALKDLEPLVRMPRSPKQALSALAFYSFARVPVMIEIAGENLAWDVQGGTGRVAPNGTNVFFYKSTGTANQQWILESAGTPDTYHFRSVHSGRYIHIAGAIDAKGSSLQIYDGAGSGYAQTYFKAVADKDGFLHFITVNGLAFDLAGGVPVERADLQLWENHGGAPQAFYVYPAPDPADTDALYPPRDKGRK